MRFEDARKIKSQEISMNDESFRFNLMSSKQTATKKIN